MADLEALQCLAIGRLLRICSRPYQPGDDEEYEKVRDIIMYKPEHHVAPYRPNWVRDRNSGAQGD